MTTVPTRTTTLTLAGREVTVTDRDRTRPFLLLHGGAGVASMADLADLLAAGTPSRVLLPTHPGFGGTPRADSLATTRDLAVLYVDLLDELDLSDVTVVGNSFGGWLAAEIALLASPRVSGAVILDAIGIDVAEHPMTSVVGLAPADLARLAFHDPATAPTPPAGGGAFSPDVAALLAYAGPTMSDPTLLGRLAAIDLPVRVLWGDSDGIVTPDYGRAFAAAIPGATFGLLPRTGHLPQVEDPEGLLDVLLDPGR